MKNLKFEQFVKKCPIKVKEMDFFIYGAFVWMKNNQILKKPYIEIRKNENELIKIGALFHEQSHYECWVNNCRCRKRLKESPKNRGLWLHWLAEYHAFLGSLKKAYKIKNKELIKTIFYMIRQSTIGQDAYDKAYKTLIKTKTYKKCKEFINEKVIDN